MINITKKIEQKTKEKQCVDSCETGYALKEDEFINENEC